MLSRSGGRKRERPPKYTPTPHRSNVIEKPKWRLSREMNWITTAHQGQ